METIEQRLQKLKALGAGDKQCDECLHLQSPDMNSMAICKKCIHATPAFTLKISALMREPVGQCSAAILYRTFHK